MYRFLIIVLFNISLIHGMSQEYRPTPPYETYRILQKNLTALAAFEKISQENPEINFNDYKYQHAYRGWNQNFALYFISHNDGKIKHTFYYNCATKQLEKCV